MIKRQIQLILTSLVVLATGLVGSARADISTGDLSDHRFTVSFLGGNQTLTETAGTSYSFSVMLTEEITSGSDPFLISDPAWGMGSGSFNVAVNGASAVTGATGNSGFDSPVVGGSATVTPTLVTVSQAGSVNNVFGDTTTHSLMLGTISGTFQGNGTTTLQLFDDPTINELSSIAAKFFALDPSPVASDTTVLPQLSFAGGTITLNSINAVPEPSSLALAGLAAGGAWWRTRRRKAATQS